MISIDITLKKSDGTSEIVPAIFYNEIDEMSLTSWDLFHQKLRVAPEWFQELNQMSKDDANDEVGQWPAGKWAAFYYLIADFTSCFSNVDLNAVLHLPLKPNYSDEEKKSLHDTGGALLTIYHQIIEALATYEPTAIETFTHKGKTYRVFTTLDSFFGPETPAPNMNTITAIQALQSEHVLTSKDPDTGEFVLENFKDKTDRAILAALSRRVYKNGKVEKIPLNLVESEKWLEKRMEEFSDIPMNIAENVYFFLLNSKTRSLNTRSFNLLSIALSPVWMRPK